MKKTIAILSVILLYSCKKTMPENVWECTANDNIKIYVVSDTMPIIKTVNEFGQLVVCNCKKSH